MQTVLHILGTTVFKFSFSNILDGRHILPIYPLSPMPLHKHQ
jgi:hypothetical protein